MKKPRRDSVVSIRISDDEMARLRAKATAQGVTVSELLRRSALREVALPLGSCVREPVTVTVNTSRPNIIFSQMVYDMVRAGTISLGGQ